MFGIEPESKNLMRLVSGCSRAVFMGTVMKLLRSNDADAKFVLIVIELFLYIMNEKKNEKNSHNRISKNEQLMQLHVYAFFCSTK